MTAVRNVNIQEAIMAFQYMEQNGIQYADIIIESENTVYFLASKFPSSNEIIGDSIIKSINFDEDDDREDD